MKTVAILSMLITCLFSGQSLAEMPTEKTAFPPEKLHQNVMQKKKDNCKTIQTCGNLVMMDCNSSIDGPQYYFDNTDGKLLMACGGACMIPDENDPTSCKKCPPDEWLHCESLNSEK